MFLARFKTNKSALLDKQGKICTCVLCRVAKGQTISGKFKEISRNLSMGTSSGEFWKYSKFETYQEFMGIVGTFMKLYHVQT